jgi:thiosulfate reductase cytochrome b subunit
MTDRLRRFGHLVATTQNHDRSMAFSCVSDHHLVLIQEIWTAEFLSNCLFTSSIVGDSRTDLGSAISAHFAHGHANVRPLVTSEPAADVSQF